jgi:hypothetical protein
MLRGVFLLFILFALEGCSENIAKTIASASQKEGRTDGAIVGYYFPRAIWKLTASYDASSGLISVSADAKPSILPDTDAPMHWLSYAHAGLSDDDITIGLDGLLLKTVASKSSDQTVKIVEAANTLLTQIGTTKTSLEKAFATGGPAESGRPQQLTDSGCITNLKSEVTVDLSFIGRGRQRDLLWGAYCSLYVHVTVSRLGMSPFKIAGGIDPTLQAAQNLEYLERICERAVCFRPSQVVAVAVSITVKSNIIGVDGKPQKNDKNEPVIGASNAVLLPKAGAIKPVPMTLTQQFNPVTVPSGTAGLAFVEFGRRAFVENHTSLTFTDGVVSEFKSTDPSIIANAITLSSDLLKTVVLTVPIAK